MNNSVSRRTFIQGLLFYSCFLNQPLFLKIFASPTNPNNRLTKTALPEINDVKSFASHVKIALKEGVVTEEDHNRMIECSKAVRLPKDREIIGFTCSKYVLDGKEYKSCPLGESGNSFEAYFEIYTCGLDRYKNLL